MESVELFFNTLNLFLVVISIIVLATALTGTMISFREAKKQKFENTSFDTRALFYTAVVPIVYLSSVAIVNLGLLQ